MNSGSVWFRIGAVLGALAVAAGAFGAHGLRARLDARSMEVFHTAAQYHMVHALAIVAVASLMIATKTHGTAQCVAAGSFLVGILIFSGSLYALAITGQRWLGAITPIGGVAFIVGWIVLAAARFARE
ncbi:MAG TPA: DUF423 domain-containing protein [Isosphaeraceae bacterium]|jgi:uncharacterized membrane protein YgdD (TMEM256/DUF423 family)|nr:DUF423 domain-containing protein [Isosphaeraceae bacterium]